MEEGQGVGSCQSRPRLRELRVEMDRFLEGVDSGVKSGFVVAPIFCGAAQVSVVGFLIIGRLGREHLLLRVAQLRF